MGATLDALHRLQSIEDKLRSVREQIEAKRRSVRARQRRVAQLERDLTDANHAIQRAQVEADKFELDRKEREQNVAKLREALNRTKSNKEYAALLTQLNTAKADILRIEDSALMFMTRVDEERKKQTETKDLLAKEQAQVAELTHAAQGGEAKLASDLKEWEDKRAEAASQVPVSVLATFERACERHDGEAMAVLERSHPKRAEYVCSGCNMSIPLEVANTLQSRDEVQLCHTCSRILYLETQASALKA